MFHKSVLTTLYTSVKISVQKQRFCKHSIITSKVIKCYTFPFQSLVVRDTPIVYLVYVLLGNNTLLNLSASIMKLCWYSKIRSQIYFLIIFPVVLQKNVQQKYRSYIFIYLTFLGIIFREKFFAYNKHFVFIDVMHNDTLNNLATFVANTRQMFLFFTGGKIQHLNGIVFAIETFW